MDKRGSCLETKPGRQMSHLAPPIAVSATPPGNPSLHLDIAGMAHDTSTWLGIRKPLALDPEPLQLTETSVKSALLSGLEIPLLKSVGT